MPRLKFDWMVSRSEASQKGWESRWERMWELGQESKLGEKGRAYIDRKYGEEVFGEEPPEDYHDEYDNPYDVEIEY